MRVILANKTAELVEKKSRFIANIFYVKNIEEANAKLEEIRKKYYDAKHNCFAYVIGEKGDIVKSSDDGEPSGTAGHPMLDILMGFKLTNIIAIVTRYFGGVLLGTGGLVRAYSDSLKMALDSTTFSDINNGFECEFLLNYDEHGLFKTDAIEIKKEFAEKINIQMLFTEENFEKSKKDLINITKGRVNIDKNNQKTYYIDDKGAIIYI